MRRGRLARRDVTSSLITTTVFTAIGLSSLPSSAQVPKYRLDKSQTIVVSDTTLFRMVRVADGELGGFIGSEENVSQAGTCFAHKDSRVYGNARVLDDAQVYGEVFGDAIISGKATIVGKAYDHTMVSGEAKIIGEAFGNSVVRGNATVVGRIYGAAMAAGSEIVLGDRGN